MTDLLGPASAPNSTTSRPSEGRTFGGSDTWMKDCSSPSLQDGTVLQANFMNALLAQVRRAVRGTGIAENNASDDLLLNAILTRVPLVRTLTPDSYITLDGGHSARDLSVNRAIGLDTSGLFPSGRIIGLGQFSVLGNGTGGGINGPQQADGGVLSSAIGAKTFTFTTPRAAATYRVYGLTIYVDGPTIGQVVPVSDPVAGFPDISGKTTAGFTITPAYRSSLINATAVTLFLVIE